MQCTDIQINDWMYLSEATKYPMRVDSIGRDYCYLDFDGNEGEPFDGIYGEDGIAPIPLTIRIILLNMHRFASRNLPSPFWYDRDKFYCGCDGAYEFEVKYVHEVQHLLRVLGFTEEADNFKIKKEEQL